MCRGIVGLASVP